MDGEVEVEARSRGSQSESMNFPTPGLSIELLSKEETTVVEIKEKLEPLCRYSVTSEQDVRRLREEVIRILEKPVRARRAGGTILHSALGVEGSDEPDIYGTLLATGVNPEVLSAKGGFAPLHVAAVRARPKCVQLMKECRASPTLKTHDGESALDCMKQKLNEATHLSRRNSEKATPSGAWISEEEKSQYVSNAQEVLMILNEWTDNVQVESLASLAKRGQFYSVQNLIRRGLFALSPEEFTEKLDNKTAQEWTLEHGRKDIADEIAFWTSRAENIRSVIDVNQVIRNTIPGDFPDFQRPSGDLPLNEASEQPNRVNLMKSLQPFTVFPITTTEHYRKFRNMVIDPFESELDTEAGTGAAVFCASGYSRFIDEESYGVLLAMGIDPDRPDKNSLRPSHLTALFALSPILQFLIECRVDLEAQIISGDNVIEYASYYLGKTDETPWSSTTSQGGKSKGPTPQRFQTQLAHTLDVLGSALEKRRIEGPESLASLARRGRFYSIQNLIRRPGLVKWDEFNKEHYGLTVQEWAIEHGRPEIAAEIGFWKTYNQDEEPFPRLFNPPHPELRKFIGRKILWSELRRFLQPYATRPVTCEEEDSHLTRVQEVLEERNEEIGFAIVHEVLGQCGGDDPELFGMMAATGFNLNIETRAGSSPVSFCAAFTRAECLRILVDCRVVFPSPGNYSSDWTAHAVADMCLKNTQRGAPPQAWTGDMATHVRVNDQEAHQLSEKAKLVTELLENTPGKQPDSFVILAMRKAFAAVQHLMRKRPSPITLNHYLETHLGRTAEKWAEIHGRLDIAIEIRYRKRFLTEALNLLESDRTAGGKYVQPAIWTKPGRVRLQCDWREAFQKTLEAFGLTSVAQLGETANLPLLEGILETFEGVSITTPQDDTHLKRISRVLSTATHEGETIVQKFLSGKGHDSHHELFGKLLALGVEPDGLDSNPNCRSAKTCILYVKDECLRRLHLCRIDVFGGVCAGYDAIKMTESILQQALEIVDEPGLHPEGRSHSVDGNKLRRDLFDQWKTKKSMEERQVILDFLIRAKSEPQPSLVKLAKEREFEAVQSIIRRGVAQPREYSEKIENKDAGTWAFLYGVEAVADEVYFRKSMLFGNPNASKGANMVAASSAAIRWNNIPSNDADNDVPPNSLLGICKELEDFPITNVEDAQKLKGIIEDFAVDDNDDFSWFSFRQVKEALEGDKDRVFSQFLAVGFNPDVKICSEGWSPLGFCVEELKPKCLRLALLCRPSKNSKLSKSGDPLSLATFQLLQTEIREQAGSHEVMLLDDAKRCVWECLLIGLRSLVAKFTALRNPMYSQVLSDIALAQNPLRPEKDGGKSKGESLYAVVCRMDHDKELLSEFQHLLRLCTLKTLEWKVENLLVEITSSTPKGATSKSFSEQILIKDQDFLEFDYELMEVIKDLEEYLAKKSKTGGKASKKNQEEEEGSPRNEGNESLPLDPDENDAEILLKNVCVESRKFLRILSLMVITNLLDSAEKCGRVSLAELAKHRCFPVIHNLIRRTDLRVVDITEYFEEFDGLTAFEWAQKAARVDVAMEIRFWQFYESVGMIAKGVKINFCHVDGATGVTLRKGERDGRTREIILDFFLWLTLENPSCLTPGVKRQIESELPRWLAQSGRSAESFLQAWFDHIYCERMPGPRKGTHDHDPQLQRYIRLAQEVHGARNKGRHTKPELAWLLLVLAMQILIIPQKDNTKMKTSLFQAWTEDPKKNGFQTQLFAELVDACLMWIEPDDWPLVDRLYTYFDERKLQAATSLRGSILRRILRLGLMLELPAPCQNMQAISPEVFWKLVKEKTDDMAIGVLRKGDLPFEGPFEHLISQAPKDVTEAEHIAFVAERAVLLQQARQMDR